MKYTIQTEIYINSTPEAVFKALTDFPGYQNWNPLIIKSEGQAIQGSRLVNTMRIGSREMTFKPVLLNVRQPEMLEWEGRLFFKGLFDGRHYFIINKINDNTVHFIHGEHFTGLLSGYIFRKIGEDTRTGFLRMNTALKQYVESL
ncbi:MAG: hypothetical protein Fur0041_21010 [Bacteroidia bacterium]